MKSSIAMLKEVGKITIGNYELVASQDSEANYYIFEIWYKSKKLIAYEDIYKPYCKFNSITETLWEIVTTQKEQ